MGVLTTLVQKIGNHFRLKKNQTVDIVIERRSATITTIQVNAGTFGPKALTRLVLLQIIEELDQAGAHLEERMD